MSFGRALCVFFAIFAACAEALAGQESKVVQTTSGSVRGYKEDDLYIFYSIPYATAPTGRDKFKAPLPAPVWHDTFEAVDKYIVCHQAPLFPLPRTSLYQEDCLVANVFVPDTEQTKLPVTVYVHGGAYQIGYGNMFTPKALVKSKRVIAVTFNYRLGAHGFLCLGTEDAPGNAGMKDQVALLRWVQKNIAQFGGNPDDVTIQGYSAGSSAVDLLMLSKSTKGLFNKVIPESGANVGVWSVQIDPLHIAKDFASTQNFTNVDDIYALEEFYKSAPFEQLTATNFLSNTDSTFIFVPCIERYTNTERFLDDAPVNILKNGNYNKVPILYGFSNMEGLLRLQMGYDLFKDKMNSKFSDFLPADLEFESEAQKEEVAKKIKEFYFGDKAIGEDTILAYIDYFSDVMFAYPTLRAVKYHAEAGNNQVYLYEYSFPEEQQFPVLPESIQVKIRGATHCAQSAAIFDSPPEGNWVTPENKSEDFKRLRAIMRELWLTFITTGKPVTSESSLPAWPPADASRAPYMSLTMPPRLINGPLLEHRTRFWDVIYDKYYRTPVPPSTPPPKIRSEL